MSEYGQKFFRYSLAGSLPVFLYLWLLPEAFLPALSAYGISVLFVGSNYFVIRRIDSPADSSFYRIFLVSLALRFLIVIGVLLFMLTVVKIHHIFFTVNFIIAYIFHSVIEIIFLHKTLQNETD